MENSKHKKQLNLEKVKIFWAWFCKNEKMIKEALEDDSHSERNVIVERLDNYILEFGMFTWIIGPSAIASQKKMFYFTISPNGDKELLRLSKSIVKLAPQLIDWQFNSSKPVTEMVMDYTVYDNNMLERNFTISDWNFVLKINLNQGAKIIIEAKNISNLDKDTKISATNLVVVALLGEEKRINSVDEIIITDNFDEENRAISKNISFLHSAMSYVN